MWKKLTMALLALGFVAAANLQLCCRPQLPGTAGELSLSPESLRRGVLAARMAAEEITEGPALLPELPFSYRLSLRPPESSSKLLSAALLEQTEGVSLGQGVYVKGICLGMVDSADMLRRQLRDHIHSQLPSWAVSGYISEELSFSPRYTRSERLTPMEDMVLLITGMAPVMYSDGKGYTARA